MPDKNPRTECGNQSVAIESSTRDAPFDLLSNVRIIFALVGLALKVLDLVFVVFIGCLVGIVILVVLVCIIFSFRLM